ncbi:hypothetical protein MVI01_28310 [Myxococcus virescens]|uniref:Uncharacterized protein n=1 Tax=Myxococcus virescens TaxID=83456 RepID=A0A511HBW9_9BACT|nr:hypothetical protein MVI01_28310 [Myxococcus virescens]
MGGAEDDARAAFRQQGQGIQAAEAGHVDVQQHHVHAARAHGGQDAIRVRGLAADLRVRERREQPRQALSGEQFVIGDEDAKWGAQVRTPGWGPARGRVTVTRVRTSPPSSTRRAAPP